MLLVGRIAFELIIVVNRNGSVAQWITRLTTNQEIAGSTPARVGKFLEVTFGRYLRK